MKEMGQAPAVLKALGGCGCCSGLESCNKYVLNSMRCESRCSDCCEIEVQTDEIALSDSGSEEEFEAMGCLKYHHA